MTSKASKILGLFLILALGFIIFLARVFDVATSERYKNIATKKEVDTPLRGDIITADGYHVAKSQKRYAVVVEPENIDETKKEVFVKLLAVYAKKSEAELFKLLDSDKKVTIISGIDARDAKNFRQLSSVLDKLQVFTPKKIGNKFVRYGLEIAENEFFREYPFVDAIEPLIGYIKVEDLSGLLGLEKFYESALSGTQKGLTEGQRDVGGNFIYNERSKNSFRRDGLNIKLNINLKLQKLVEKHLDEAKKELRAESLLACVMESSTGKIVSMASSNRYEPYNVPKDEIANMKVDFVQYVYEPGSTIKPIVFSMLIEDRKLTVHEGIDCKYGRFQLGQKTVVDEHKMGVVPAEDIIINSSNVGMAQISQRLDAHSYQEWLKKFGFEQKSGIDLPFELPGNLPKKAQFSSELTKGILGYGYGMRANFVQLMAAYNVFNNKGILLSPRVVDSLIIDGMEQKLPPPNKRVVISEQTASKMKAILIKVVEKGTGTKAKVDGLDVGGKTGTAHIAKNGTYANAYNSSFIGFANDSNKKNYTIGVLAIEPKGKHFAAETAVPVFKKIILSMQEEGMLAKPQ